MGGILVLPVATAVAMVIAVVSFIGMFGLVDFVVEMDRGDVTDHEATRMSAEIGSRCDEALTLLQLYLQKPADVNVLRGNEI